MIHNVTNNERIRGALLWLAAFLIFLYLRPYFSWTIEPFFTFVVSIPMLAIILLNQSSTSNNSKFAFFFGVICLLAGVCGGSNVIGITSMTLMAFFFNAKSSFFINVYNKYRIIYIILISLSLVSYFLVLIGIELPSHVSPPPPRNTIDYDYIIYPFYASPSVSDWRGLGIERFNGLFDEPGTVGTTSLLMLFIEKFNFRKKGNIVLLISGLLSFSLYFYIGAFLIAGLFVFRKNTAILTRFIYIIILVGSITFISTNEVSRTFIWDRVQWDKNSKTIVGDDRSDYQLKKYISDIRGTTKYFFGSPDQLRRFQNSASLEKEIVAHGFLVVVLFFVFYALYSIRFLKLSREWLIFYIVFIATLYNRPSFFSYERLLLFNLAIYSYSPRFKTFFDSSRKKVLT